MKRPISFDIESRLSGTLARAGTITTPHGTISTPAFIAVGTKADVKGIRPKDLEKLGVQAIIANAYHLYLSPGEKLISDAGGLNRFMGFDRPTMTDSGGFQVFSLGVGFGKKISKVTAEEKPRDAGVAVFDQDVATSHGKLAIVDDEGVTFTSHLDGSLHRFTPERSIEIQHGIGADIIFAFDECTSPEADHEYQKEAAERTHRWAKRSLAAHRQNVAKNAAQGIYGIVQGGRFADLRIESAQTLADMDFDGYGIGGSFSKNDILGILDKVNTHLPEGKPRHLLGIGEPEDIFIGVEAGIDTFDCVLPTRLGRTGTIFTRAGKLSITRAEYVNDFTPLEAECSCYVCAEFSKSYIHHLFRTGEMLGPVLTTAHNLHFMSELMTDIRTSIISGTFTALRDSFLATYKIKK